MPQLPQLSVTRDFERLSVKGGFRQLPVGPAHGPSWPQVKIERSLSATRARPPLPARPSVKTNQTLAAAAAVISGASTVSGDRFGAGTTCRPPRKTAPGVAEGTLIFRSRLRRVGGNDRRKSYAVMSLIRYSELRAQRHGQATAFQA
jgi:hypothetical protein